jgi:drug/metabolite transporter (DMT)-like permease
MTIFLSYLFYFVASSASSLQKRFLLKHKEYTTPEQITFAFQSIFILFLGSLIFPFFSPFYISGGFLKLTLLALACGVFSAGSNIASYLSQKHMDAGVTSILWNIYTPITIFLSSILLHEGLKLNQILGTVVLLFAIVLISKKHRIGRFSFDRYFLLTLLSGVLISGVLVAERALQNTTGFSAGVMISWGSGALALGLVSLFWGAKHKYSTREVLTTGGLQFIGSLSYVILVWVSGNLSVVSSVTTFKVVIIFIAAAVFLNEREDLPRKIFGSILAVLGLLLMK